MNEASPIMYVFAGNNGSGKSTIRNLIVDRLGISVNIDPDALARSLDSEHPDRRKVSAGKEAIKLARECIQHRRDFSVETTLAGGNVLRLIQDARADGFEVTMFYVGLGDYRLNIERVAARVRNGGHDIPTEDIIRRHTTSFQNLLTHLEMIDHLVVIDNSEASGEIVMQADYGISAYLLDPAPSWVHEINDALSKHIQ
ncbi:zeta toxin family protein [Paenibacillus sp. HN-1]|uniref:zeta toxin family protein n=1 Tax=Paenibacillus TaxID=44249 RepID=UPI001CA8A204|nr:MULTISPECIES: zeta toxin family protein [Paenibacillus]MBY9080742.1 zeta toxin family protein [Paenibacillus sp. CGMCC 1.18879]MBY9085266.1 zeta toxin family protein [Paenibacillus sinensis]